RKALHRDHEHKTPDTGRVAARKCEWHRELLPRPDSRRPGRSSNPRDGVTQMTQMTLENTLGVYSLLTTDSLPFLQDLALASAHSGRSSSSRASGASSARTQARNERIQR